MAFDASHFMYNSGSDYQITNSVRWNDPDSSELERTLGTATNRKKWTFSGWVKNSMGHGNDSSPIVSTEDGQAQTTLIGYGGHNSTNDAHRISLLDYLADGTERFQLITTATFRDPAQWYHIIVAYDSAQGTAANRVKLYVNGTQITDFSRENYPPQNYETHLNSAVATQIGQNLSRAAHFHGYMAEMYFIDGTIKAPADFGETGNYGEWKPIEYSGSYGDNGFYLDFKSSGVGTAGSGTIGADRSGNGNHFTSAGLAVTDQTVDTPTTNFPTLNPIIQKYTGGGANSEKLEEGNLRLHALASNGVSASAWSTMSIADSGKWYWEFVTQGGTTFRWVGVSDNLEKAGVGTPKAAARTYGTFYKSNGKRSVNETESNYGSSYGAGDIIGVALDMDNNNIYFAKNGTWQNSGDPTSGSDGTGKANTSALKTLLLPALMIDPANTIGVINFGQDSSFAGNKTAQGNQDGNAIGDFYYAPPSNFLALCTNNLPEPAVIPSENFNTVLWTGNGGTQSITGVNFQSDFIWTKQRSATRNHSLTDAVRGVTKNLSSDLTEAESTTSNRITAFGSDGFSLGASGYVNVNNGTYVAWNWKANGSGSSNTNGDINSTVSANVGSGFSIVSFTGNGSDDQTVGHGLSAVPEMIIYKDRENANNDWKVYHSSRGNAKDLRLNSSAAEGSSTAWGSTTPTSSVFTVNGSNTTNVNNNDSIAYCFHSVAGYSAVGSYIGNGNADGVFLTLDFAPAMVLFKQTNTSENWVIQDNRRDFVGNPATGWLYPDISHSEEGGANRVIDLVSNGIKIRTAGSSLNTNNGTYIYLAFAETPFKYSNGK